MTSDSIRRYRLAAVFAAALFLVCELVAWPFAAMGVCDDWSYLRTAAVLEATGRVVYNGWATAMVGWQLLPAALLMKVFGPGYTAPRVLVMVVGASTVFLLQRTLVRMGVNERNATLGALMLGLQPTFLELSASFMTDIPGLFALVLCLYLCVRALQAADGRAALGWIVAAVVLNAALGTSRQIAWLGLLVMVPCTLWVLRRNRRILTVGAALTLGGAMWVLGCMRWFARQPYSITEKILPKVHGLHDVFYIVRQMARGGLEVFFLLLPLVLVFVPELRRRTWRFTIFVVVTGAGYGLAAWELVRHHTPGSLLEPLLGDWLGPHAYYDSVGLASEGPVVLEPWLRTLLTALAVLGTFGVIAFVVRLRTGRVAAGREEGLSWREVLWLVVPFGVVYFGLLIPRAATNLVDRYLLELEVVGTVLLLKGYQEFVQARLPGWMTWAVAIVAIFSIASLHDMFSLYRARVTIAGEVKAAGIADNTLDGGFEFDSPVELERQPYLNDKRINPKSAFQVVDPYLGGESCDGKPAGHDVFPHFAPHLGIAFTPDACAGDAGLQPVRYSRWLGRDAALYVVRYQAIKEAR